MLLSSQGDIVFANFPFEEDKNIAKPRPCLVLAVDDVNQKILAAKFMSIYILADLFLASFVYTLL